jgi:hypothetical protein
VSIHRLSADPAGFEETSRDRHLRRLVFDAGGYGQCRQLPRVLEPHQSYRLADRAEFGVSGSAAADRLPSVLGTFGFITSVKILSIA